MIKSKVIAVSLLAVVVLFSYCYNDQASCGAERYEEDWRSLAKHETPDWMLDLKFGIYCHWGAQSQLLEESGGKNYKQEEVIAAYDRWSGEKFSAKEWVEFFKRSGAQFVGHTAMHGSGCVHWDSDVTSWNVVNKGARVDIMGELIREAKANDMKYVATFHNVRKKGIWGERSLSDRTFVEPNYDDSNIREDREWMDGWCDRVTEAVTKYDIDMAWFDTSFGGSVQGDLGGYVNEGMYDADLGRKPGGKINSLSERYQKRFIASYFNHAAKQGREVEVIFKTNDLPMNVGMRDIENGGLSGLQYDPWMADINMMHHIVSWDWFYVEQSPLKDTNCLVDMLIDITSKNGRLLLNVPPKADGTFAEPIVKILTGVGDWLAVNGEGIYGTTPWTFYGEGKTKDKYNGHHAQGKNGGRYMAQYGGDDLRFTTKGNAIYVFAMADTDLVSAKTLGSDNKLYDGEVERVTLLGYDGDVEWNHKPEALEIKMPKGVKESVAYCFKVEVEQ